MKTRILVADDDDALRILYKQIFETENFEVDLAENGQKAFMLMQNGGYDLVLLDIQMPNMDGFMAMEALKRVPPTKPNGPIYFLTNDKDQATMAKGISFPVNGYLIKSDYTPDELVAEVKKILDLQKNKPPV